MIISRGLRLTLPAEPGWKVGAIVEWRCPAIYEITRSSAFQPQRIVTSRRPAAIESMTDSQANVRVILESITVPHNKGW
jgi:hypothetical protein